MNIPIYRAKKIDSDEYIIGAVVPQNDGSFKIVSHEGAHMRIADIIDESTLSIHFPDMRDSEGNKIFASLSEDGKGGDICVYIHGNFHNSKYYCIFKDGSTYFMDGKMHRGNICKELSKSKKIIGVQE